MPDNGNGNYLQHITEVMLRDGLTFEDICATYDNPRIKVSSVRKAYTDPQRGNLPLGITPTIFYETIIQNFYTDQELLTEFARQLHTALKRDSMLTKEWEDRINKVSGFSEAFCKETFQTYLIYLLSLDKLQKKKARKLTPEKNPPDSPKRVYKKSGECLTALSFSARFFNSGAKKLLNASQEELAAELRRLSKIFHKTARLERLGDTEPQPLEEEELLPSLLTSILAEAKSGSSRELLKIKGPFGCYKNRIIQYLCIALDRAEEGVLPFYIDIAAYERLAEGNERISEGDFLKRFEKDLELMKQIAARQPEKCPLLLLDGIRDFSWQSKALYYSIKERCSRLHCKQIICVDTDFTLNNLRKYEVHPLISNHHTLYLRIRSMNLNRKKESVELIKNCIEVFAVDIPKGITPESIYEHLLRLEFLTVDAYWLVYMLSSNLSELTNKKNNISALYESICQHFLGIEHSMDSAAEIAYEFEFGQADLKKGNPYYDLRWRLIRKHRSVLDFLLAKLYIKKISEINFRSRDRERIVESLSFFDMVLQKSITRFVVAMLKGNDHYEHQIMIIANKYYDDLSLFGKSELTFWMARLTNSKRKSECLKLLKGYYKKEKKRYAQNEFAGIGDKRDAAFLIRGISVSLIYENDKEALKDYLSSLLTDKIANSVNRGFHLEYYGDKPYIPNQALLDFEDDVSKGESAMTVLCLSLDRRIKRNDVGSYMALLEIMTLCNLIQARTEYREDVRPMDVTPYLGKCLKYLSWAMKQRSLKGLSGVCVYFNWMYHQLDSHLKNPAACPLVHHGSDTMNTLSHASSVCRAGWVNSKIPHPENIVEHMYNCWLIGMLYLPKESELPDYSKEEILQMLLIHDLGETETGDISRPQKQENRQFYDHQERTAMQGLLLSGTYPTAVDLNDYMRLWDHWDARKGTNYFIAKDIDNIQTIYQFCTYFLCYSELFSQEDICYWLDGLMDIETDIGKDIADTLITKNPAFHKLLTAYLQEEDP